jgi:hypothetical protein
LIGIVGTGLLTSCSEEGLPEDPAEAWMLVDVGYDGTITGYLKTSPDSPVAPVETAHAAVEEMTTAREITVSGAETALGPYAKFRIEDGYQAGKRPSVDLTLGPEVLEGLRDGGVERLRFTVVVPYVPHEIESTSDSTPMHYAEQWWLDPQVEGTTSINLTLEPDSEPWVRSLVILAVGFIGVVAALALLFVDRTSRLFIVLAAATGLCGLVALWGLATLAAAPHAESLAVQGLLSGEVVSWVTWLPVLLMLLAPLDLAVAAWALWIRRRRRPVSAERDRPDLPAPPELVAR